MWVSDDFSRNARERTGSQLFMGLRRRVPRAGRYILRMSGQAVSDFVHQHPCNPTLQMRGRGPVSFFLRRKKELYLLELSSATAWLPFLTVLEGCECSGR